MVEGGGADPLPNLLCVIIQIIQNFEIIVLCLAPYQDTFFSIFYFIIVENILGPLYGVTLILVIYLYIFNMSLFSFVHIYASLV